MRLLIYGLNYAPEPTGIGRYTGELVSWLQQQGHDLRVITTPPYYPWWQVQPPHRNRYRTTTAAGLQVHRTPLWVPSRPSGLTRLLHLGSFALSSWPVLQQQRRWQPQALLAIAPAFFCAPAAWRFARRLGIPSLLHIQDFEVDAACELGLLRGRRLFRDRVRAWEQRQLLGFDAVSTISEPMRQRLLAKGVPPERTRLLPNWVNTDRIFPLDAPSPLRQQLGIPEQARVCLYSGSMNRKQGLELLATAAHQLQDCPDLVWVFCGNGPRRADLEARCRDLSNVRFLDLQPESGLNALLNLADIHLLPQKAAAADLVMPSKLLGILASGRPVVATAPPGSELHQIAHQAGLVTPPEDTNRFVQALRMLLEQPERRQKLGAAGYELAYRRFSHRRVLRDFEQTLTQLSHAPLAVNAP